MADRSVEAKTSNLDLIAQLRAPCGDSVMLLTAEGSSNKYDPLRLAAAREIERLTAALERVLHYWQERYGMEFEKTDEVLIDEVRRVQRALAPAPEPRDG